MRARAHARSLYNGAAAPHAFALQADTSPASQACLNSASLRGTSRGIPRPMQYMVARSVHPSDRALSHDFLNSRMARSSFGATPSP